MFQQNYFRALSFQRYNRNISNVVNTDIYVNKYMKMRMADFLNTIYFNHIKCSVAPDLWAHTHLAFVSLRLPGHSGHAAAGPGV